MSGWGQPTAPGVLPTVTDTSRVLPSEPAPLVAVCDAVLDRALEVAGKRLAGRAKHRLDGVPPSRVHMQFSVSPADLDRLLGGAWDSLPDLVGRHGCCGVLPEAVERTLDRYARDLLLAGMPSDVAELRTRLYGLTGA